MTVTDRHGKRVRPGDGVEYGGVRMKVLSIWLDRATDTNCSLSGKRGWVRVNSREIEILEAE